MLNYVHKDDCKIEPRKGRKNIDSRITGKKFLIHAAHKEKMPIYASRKNIRDPLTSYGGARGKSPVPRRISNFPRFHKNVNSLEL